MSVMNSSTRATAASNWQMFLSLLVMLLLLFAGSLQAAPGGGKGGGKDAGGIGGSGARPELHFQWRLQLAGPYSGVRPALGPDGTVYAVDVYDHLYAVAPDGSVRWSVADAGSKGLAVGPDGTIYTGNEDWIRAYLPDGSLKWTFIQTPRAFVLIDVAVGPDGHIYAVASSGMGVFSLEDGGDAARLRWTNPEAYARTFVGYSEIGFGPTADGRDRQLYFHANGHTRAVRLSDGASVFTLGGGNTIPRVSPLDGSWHRPAEAFDPAGERLWSFAFPLATGTTTPTLGRSGTHYAVNSGRVVYAIDPFGREAWQADLGEFVGLPDADPTETLLAIAAGGSATHPAALKAIGTRNGGALWRMEFPADDTGLDQFVDSGVAFTPDGATAYVMTAIAGGGTGLSRCYLNAVATDPSLPGASTQLRATDVALDARSRRGKVSFTGRVTVMDENLGLISGATVLATWTRPDGSTLAQSATSGGSGVASFSLSGEGGLYRLTVTGIDRDGYVFDARHSLLEAARAWY